MNHSSRNFLSALLGTDLDSPDQPAACVYCKKPQPSKATGEQRLKKCGRCLHVLYCSRQCQKEHWKLGHKTQCSLGALANDVYLDSFRKEEEAIDQLIDAYRMRVEDDYAFRHENRGLYARENPFPDFRSFLDLAESRQGVMPKWWNKEKRRICERRAVDEDGWSCIAFAVEKHDIQEHYNDHMMPMKLRMLAEKVYGFGVMDPMGQL
ncbi:hypothetical protein JOM56_001503 [Amanita muscaria]